MVDSRQDRVARGGAFSRALVLPGWAGASAWGYDPVLEGYWVELWDGDDVAGPGLRIGAEHLIGTVSGLARALAHELELDAVEAYLALTAA